MRIFENQTFFNFDDRDSGSCFQNTEFYNCFFDFCLVSIAENIALRSTVRHIRLSGCRQSACSIGNAIVEDVVVDGLKNEGDILQTFGAVFKHVELLGRIDNLMITNDVLPDLFLSEIGRERQILQHREANRQYYATVDWALDISKGEFKDLDIRGVPGRLIRRDPETQILVTREKAMTGEFRKLNYRDPLTPFSIQFMLDHGWEDGVLIAPKRDRSFRKLLADIKLLRKAGIAEPD